MGNNTSASTHLGVRHVVLAVVAAVAIFSTACGTGSDPDDAAANGEESVVDQVTDELPPVDGGKLVIGVPSESPGWNPHNNQWAHAPSLVGSSMLEPLTTIDSDLNAVPLLAESWTANGTFDSYTVKLRPGVTFHDGSPFDAAAVKANIDDTKTGLLTSLSWGSLFAEVEVVDDLTVRIGLQYSMATFPATFMASQSAMMMAPSMFAAEDRGASKPLGTGPFKFETWDKGSTLTVVKNDSYWQSGLPHLDEIEFAVLTDATAMSTALQAEDVDMVFSPWAATVAQAPSDYTVVKDWSSEPGMVVTNTSSQVKGMANPLANEHARKAIAYATDRQALADYVGAGVETINSPFPPDSKWGMPSEDNGYVDFDLTKAREEVAAYEADEGSSLKVVLSAIAGSDNDAMAQLLQSQWSEAGVETTIESFESTAFGASVATGSFQLALFTIYGAPDPTQNEVFWSAEFVKPEGQLSINFAHFTTPEMEENLRLGRTSTDFATRKKAYDDVVREINRAAINIWTYATPYSLVANPRVHGLKGASEVPFANFQPKTWVGQIWVEG